MIFGKLIAGALGLIVGNIPGLLLGVFVGHAFDRGMARTAQFGSPEQIARIKKTFFETTFRLLGHMAKADGRISEEEIAHTRMLFGQMGLDAAQRKRAIELFQEGAKPEFEPEIAVRSFTEACGRQPQMQQTLLLFLVSLALSDSQLHDSERNVLTGWLSPSAWAELPLTSCCAWLRPRDSFTVAPVPATPAKAVLRTLTQHSAWMRRSVTKT